MYTPGILAARRRRFSRRSSLRRMALRDADVRCHSAKHDAEEAQTFVYQHITPKAQDPLGWDNQIGEWAAFLATYERRVKLLPRKLRDDRLSWFDVTPAIGGAAGNVFINASRVPTVRLGYNLPAHFIEPIRAVPSALLAGEEPIAKPEWDA